MNKPHKHAALIKAWADGAEVQFYFEPEEEWVDAPAPVWGPSNEYRIKSGATPNSVSWHGVCMDPAVITPGYSRREALGGADWDKFLRIEINPNDMTLVSATLEAP